MWSGETDMQGFYPFYDPKDDDFFIAQCFDYELDEYRGSPLSRVPRDSEKEVIEYVANYLSRLPNNAREAFKRFKEQSSSVLDGILD